MPDQPVAPAAEAAATATVDQLWDLAAQAEKARNWPALVEYATRLLAQQPDDLPSLLMRGHALGQLGQEASALANFQRAVAVDPNSAYVWISLCWYRILTNAVADARAACEKARTIDPGSMAATVNLGHTHLLQGDRRNAWLWYEKSVAYRMILFKEVVFPFSLRARFYKV